jgi:hypothetical protein
LNSIAIAATRSVAEISDLLTAALDQRRGANRASFLFTLKLCEVKIGEFQKL